MALINTDEGAKRLARVILSDIELYSRERPRAGETLEAQIEEGRRLFGTRVAPALIPLFAVVLSDRRAAQKQALAAPAEMRATPAPEVAPGEMMRATPAPEVAASELSARHNAITAVNEPVSDRTPSPIFSASDSTARRPRGLDLAAEPTPPASIRSSRGVAVDEPRPPAPLAKARATADDVTPPPPPPAAAKPGREPQRARTTTMPTIHRVPDSPSFAPTPARPRSSASFAPPPTMARSSASFATVPAMPRSSASFATVARFGAPPQFSTAAPEVPVPMLTARLSIPRLIAFVAVAAGAVAALFYILHTLN